MEERKKSKKEQSITSSKKTITREFSAGGVVYKKLQGNIMWLITKSTPSDKYPRSSWRLPKGWLDDDTSSDRPGPLARGDRRASESEIRSAAIREVKEEGGVNAKVVEKISTESYFFTLESKKYLKFVTFYLMRWLSDTKEGPDEETEETLWCSFDEASKKLSYTHERKVIAKAKRLVLGL